MAKSSVEERLSVIEAQVAELSQLVRRSTDNGSTQSSSSAPSVTKDSPRPPSGMTLSERVLARAEKATSIELQDAPIDLAEQHDHYVYGWPKK